MTMMDLDEALKGRRSVRKYKSQPVPLKLIRAVLEAGTLAPSAKNGQQWRFTILTGKAKSKLTDLFRSELQKLSANIGAEHMGSSFASCGVMEQAPVLIMVWDAGDSEIPEPSLQSVAAAIQNMLLKAYSLGLGSLWICDIYYARHALTKYLGKPWKLVAAVSFGWPAENPRSRPRKTVDEVSEFID